MTNKNIQNKVDEEICESWIQEAIELKIPEREIEDYIVKAHNPNKKTLIKIRKLILEKTVVKKLKDKEISIGEFFEDPENLKGFVPKRLADKIESIFTFKSIEGTHDILIYNEGIYHPYGEEVIRREVRSYLGEHAKRYYVEEVIASIRDTNFINRSEIEKDKNLMCLENGVFNFETMELQPHSSDVVFITQLPIKYNPEADCPKIKQFLSEIVYKEDISILQEFFGFCLYPTYLIRVLLILHGEGGNGKTLFMRLLETFLGKKNVSSVTLKEFAIDRFAKARLYLKMANICDDLPGDAIYSTGVIKQVTGDSLVEGQFKFKDAFKFVSRAKQIFATNKLPPITDKTTALWDRIKTVTFPYEFVNKPNPENKNQKKKKNRRELLKELTSEEEISGLFNYSIKGLKRLLKNLEFSYSKTTEETRDEYERKADPVSAFIQDCTKLNSESRRDKKDFYKHYITYCKKRKLPIKSYNAFCRKILEHLGTSITEEQPKVGDKRKRVWVGIELKDVEPTQKRLNNKKGRT